MDTAIQNSKISIRKLHKYFGSSKQILNNINIDINSGEFICLLGPSGCGKSTILNIISGLDSDYLGWIYLEGNKMKEGQQPEKLAYLFQEPRLLPWLTVEKNIAFALRCTGFPKKDIKEMTQKYLDMVDLGNTAKQYIHELSGGMQHRVAIARAFAVQPDILLMDEPFSALDELTARNLRENLLKIWQKDKKTVIFVTHNAMEATFLADQIFMFKANPGEIVKMKNITLERPRNYESESLFLENQNVVKDFLEIISNKRTAS